MSARMRCVPRLRVMLGREIALGPGKADLLELIGEHGSIAEAARLLGMSYMRAWNLVRTMNACFRKPLVEAARGGQGRGGARLTPAGMRALELYRSMEEKSRLVMAREAAALRRLLR